MKRYIVRFLKCSYLAIVRTIEHDGVEHAGYMSFMVLFALFPFLVFFLVLTSFFGASELGENFMSLLISSLPDTTTLAIKQRISEIMQVPPQSLMTLAIIGSIWTASSFVEGLRTILNRVYHINSPPPYLWRRLLSILQFLAISLLIFFAMFLLVVVPIGLKKIPNIEHILDIYSPILQYWRYILICGSLFTTVASLYYVIPNVKLTFLEIIPGAVFTVLLWIISGNLLSRYIIYYNQLNIVYGSLGSIIITLLFFYLINMLFIYGAEFNYLYSRRRVDGNNP
jgi:membrane protein